MLISVLCLVAQSCLTIYGSMGCNPLGSSVHGIFQARILEWVATSYARVIFLTHGSNPRLLCVLHWQALQHSPSWGPRCWNAEGGLCSMILRLGLSLSNCCSIGLRPSHVLLSFLLPCCETGRLEALDLGSSLPLPWLDS